jgi:hypothetical protein
MQLVQKAVNVGDVQGLALVVSTLQSLGVRFRILPESNFPLSAMRKSSAILFGAPWFSRAASGLLQGTPWATAVDPEGKVVVFASHAPQGPAGSSAKRSIRREYREVFGLITVLPSNKHADEGHTIVIFSGLTPVGSHGAAAFFTSGESMRRLRKRLKEEGRRSLPRSTSFCTARENSRTTSTGSTVSGRAMRAFTSPDTDSPQVHLLSNGRYRVMLMGAWVQGAFRARWLARQEMCG